MNNKSLHFILLIILLLGCDRTQETSIQNPFVTALNQPIDYANVAADDITAYATLTLGNTARRVEEIKNTSNPTFENIFIPFDEINNDMAKARNNCFMLYWVSPDSLSRIKGIAGFQKLDSLNANIYADKDLYQKIVAVSESEDYAQLKGHRKKLVDDMITQFKQSGVNLESEKLAQFKNLQKEVNQLTSEYSTNMNTANLTLVIDEKDADGLPENFKSTYAFGETQYEIPVMPATNGPVMSNANVENTRKAYMMKYNNRASDKNLEILDQLVQKRYEIAQLMGHDSYASYVLTTRMASNPETVWGFIDGLIEKVGDKAREDHELLKKYRSLETQTKASSPVNPWDVAYYNNQILKTEYNVDNEKIREYLPMKQCLDGMFELYEGLLGLEFRKVENASVWHEEVELYDVYEGDKLQGRFYLDLFPRPDKESWFYGVTLSDGKATDAGYEVPVSMLLGNFTRPTETLPSLLSHRELSTLFHEFGHIVNGMSYKGEFASQSNSLSDFGEAMSQIFENWIWNYDILSSFAKHYETGEVLPKEMFDNMLEAKNVSSGLSAISSLSRCTYDMMLYDKYEPTTAVSTDELWRQIDRQIDIAPWYVEDTHPQASWIHINTHPVYMYGYTWSRVYAQDMFTEFEKNGLRDTATGIRYRELILANGTQRDIVEAVEEFLGRPSNNEAYIRSLGLN